MSRRCDLTGKTRQFGHRVSHANNKTKHSFKANIQVKKLYIPQLKRFIKLNLSAQAIRTIDKIGLEAALKKSGIAIADLA